MTDRLQKEATTTPLSSDFLAALEAERSVVVVLDVRGVIRHVNQAWAFHAARDGATNWLSPARLLGRPYLDFVTGEQKPLLAAAIEAARATSGVRPVVMKGECNTPARARLLTTRIAPLRDPATGALGALVVSNDLLDVSPLDEKYPPSALPREGFRAANGIITQCGCCRRARLPSGAWAMSGELLTSPDPRTSHGLCELCFETYYGDPG